MPRTGKVSFDLDDYQKMQNWIRVIENASKDLIANPEINTRPMLLKRINDSARELKLIVG